MQLTINNPTVISILESLTGKLDLPIELILELVIANTDSDRVLSWGKQIHEEMKLEGQ